MQMQIDIQTQNFSLSAPLKDHIYGKVSKLQKHFDRLLDVKFILKIEHMDAVAEGSIHIKGHFLTALSKHHDMRQAIDMLLEKLDRQIIKHKEKRHDKIDHSVSALRDFIKEE